MSFFFLFFFFTPNNLPFLRETFNAYATPSVYGYFGTGFGEDCAFDGFPLSVPVISPASPGSTRSPSVVNRPTQTTPDENSPPTGIPLSLGAPTSSGSASTSASASASASTSSIVRLTPTTIAPQQTQEAGGGTISNGVRVGNKAEIRNLLFSLCLLVVLM